jgi:PAS domain-containing protein
MIIFAEQDVIHDPPFTGMDLISCRNLLIYLKQEAQNKIISSFAYSLNPGGILFLGTSETVGQYSELFTTINNKWKVFRRKEYMSRREVQTIIPSATSNPIERMNVQARDVRHPASELAHQALLEMLSPPAAIIKPNGDIVYLNHEAKKLFGIGMASLMGRTLKEAHPKNMGHILSPTQIETLLKDDSSTTSYSHYFHKWFKVSAYSSHKGIFIRLEDVTKEMMVSHLLRLNEYSVNNAKDLVF